MKASDLGFEPLYDDDGEPFTPAELPCYWLPRLWDEDATAAEHRHAQSLCRTECPALAACRTRRRELKTLADGVWGGIIIRRQNVTAPEDPTIRQWREEFKIETTKGQPTR